MDPINNSQPENLIIPRVLAERIVTYLLSRPYGEVATMIDTLKTDLKPHVPPVQDKKAAV
jgi:hypothetical protein